MPTASIFQPGRLGFYLVAGEKEMPCGSPLVHQAQNKGKETNEDMDRRFDSDSRNNRSKVMHEACTSIPRPATESRRNERSESNNDVNLGNNYFAKGALLKERQADNSSFNKGSSDGRLSDRTRPVVNPEDTTRPLQKAGPSSLAQRMRLNSKEMKKILETDSVSLQPTNEVLKEREHLEALVEGLEPQIKMGLEKIEKMRQERRILQQHETEIEHSKEFEFFGLVMKAERTDLKGTGRHTTTCLRCNFTCHEDCKIADDDRKRGCGVMDKEGKCTVCTGKCSWDGHSNHPYLIEYKMVQETTQQANDTAVSGKSSVEDMLQKLEMCLNQLRIKVLTDMYKVRMCRRRLDEITFKPNPLTEVQYIELLIENERKRKGPGWMDRVRAFEDIKKKAEMITNIEREEDIPRLLEELIPMEQGRSKSKQILNLVCVLQ